MKKLCFSAAVAAMMLLAGCATTANTSASCPADGAKHTCCHKQCTDNQCQHKNCKDNCKKSCCKEHKACNMQ